MRPFFPFLPPALLTAGAALAAYGSYGAGLGRATGVGLPYWLQVAAALVAGVLLFGVGLWRTRRPAAESENLFSDDLAALERLVPALRRHPDGLSTLQDLIEVLFEARHRPEPSRKAETLAEREGRAHA